MDEKHIAHCKGCGKKILWAKTPEGKSIPLDAVAPVYYMPDGENEALRVNGDKTVCSMGKGRCYVTHFATCPKANEF